MIRPAAMNLPARCGRAALLGVLIVGAPAFAAPPPDGSSDRVADPQLVLARTVHPRIAYRGLERTENPVAVQATTFPARVFHDTVGVLVESVAGDAELGARGSHGLRRAAVATGPVTSSTPPASEAGAGLPGATRPAVPVGAGASAAGAVGGATRQLGGRVSSALSVLPAGGSR